MRIIIIGGTGHIGTYLVPRLVAAGHDVVVVSRGGRAPYREDAAWSSVQMCAIGREGAETAGDFGIRIRDLEPDAVIDLICFSQASAQQLVDALRGSVQHFVMCGSIWVHGPSTVVPTTEAPPRRPFGEYGIGKAAIEAYLLAEAHRTGFPATVLHPGHIVGRGWVPLNPAANFDAGVFTQLATTGKLALPNFGLETIHHVHADDVAQAFENALTHWSGAMGEAFHVTSPAALSLRGYAEAVAGWFGQTADLSFLPWQEWRAMVSEEDAEKTLEHISRSPNCSVDKAVRLLDYRPRYSSLQAVRESLDWLIEDGQVAVGGSEKTSLT